MRLIGAKEFLKTVKPGTLFMEFWMRNKQECLDLIKEWEKDKTICVKKEEGRFYFFGDNSHSLTFFIDDEEPPITINGTTYFCLFDVDKNIVGDASPTTTLNLVFDSEEEWPKKIFVEDSDDYLTKEDLKNIQNYFLKSDYFTNENSIKQWPLRALYTEEYYCDDEIVNYGLTKSSDLWKKLK